MFFLMVSVGLGVLGASTSQSEELRPPSRLVFALLPHSETELVVEAVRSYATDSNFEVVLYPVMDWPARAERQLQRCQRVARETKATVIAWYDPNDTRAVSFYTPDPGGGRINIRGLAADGAMGGYRAELVARVVRTFLQQVLISPSTPVRQAAEVDPEPPNPGTSDRATMDTLDLPGEVAMQARLSLWLGAGATLFARQQSVVPALQIGAQYRVWKGLGVELGLGWQSSTRQDVGDFMLRLESFPIQVGLSWLFDFEPLRVGLAAAAVATVRKWRVGAIEGALRRSQRSKHMVFGGRLSVRVQWQMLANLGIFADLGMEGVVREYSYGSRTSRGEDSALSPWPVRSFAQAGVALDAL